MTDRAVLETLSTEQLLESYSDAFKDINGYRPRGEYLHTREYLIHFWATFNDRLAEVEAEEAAHLEFLGFPSWTAYYNHLDRQYWLECVSQELLAEAVADMNTEYSTRGSIVPIIDAWDRGDI